MSELEKPVSVLERLDRDNQRRATANDGNLLITALAYLAPKNFYRWPLWKKLLYLPVAIMILVVISAVLSPLHHHY